MNDYFKKLNEIKTQYLEVEEKISHRSADECCRICTVDPYSIKGWREILTPIEYNVWQDIRMVGLPFYPQYPVGRFFVDFADPVKKNIIECDGKEYHQDKEKDNRRQNEMEKMGWSFVRIEGRKTYGDYQELNNYFDNASELDEDEIEEIENRLMIETSIGILRELLRCSYFEERDLSTIDDKIIKISDINNY